MGRPVTFDRDELLDRAMRLFWQHGFEGVSLQDLLKEFGINNSSFYHAFTSKESLFEEVLGYYFKNIGGQRVAPLLEDKPVADCLINYFNRLIQMNTRSQLPNGCLIAISAFLAGTDNPSVAEKVASTVRATKDRLETAFYNLLVRGIASGEIKPEIEPRSFARLLVSVIFGTNIIARAAKSREEMKDVAQLVIQMACVSKEMSLTL